jgi:membrane protein implicated in regulation of membrane protease activity
MAKWAGIFLVLMIATAILGFVLKVAGFLFQVLFFACLAGFAITVAGRWLKRRG